MLTIAKLFGKSPFKSLQNHLKKVSLCIAKLPLLFLRIEEKNMQEIQKTAEEISKLEHEADLTKNDIRNHLPRSLFMPIKRSDFLEILAIQDGFADTAEDIAVIATFKIIDNYKKLKKDFEIFFQENLKSFEMVKEVIKEFDSLLEASFGGIEAQKVKSMIEDLAFKEHEIDKIQYLILKNLYSIGDVISNTTFHMWITLIKEVGNLSNLAEKLGNRIRMILEIK